MTTTTHPSPQKVMQYTFGFAASRAQHTALELDLFTHVHQGAHDVVTLAQRCQGAERGIKMLVEALAAMGLLTLEQGKVALTPDSEMFLVRTSPAYMGAVAIHMDQAGWRWAKLTETIRTGRAPVGVESDEDDGNFFAELVQGLFAMNWPAAQMVARQVGQVNHVLDVGAGSGVWGLAFATAYPACQLVEIDRAQVIERAGRPFAEKMGTLDRVELRAGNFRDMDFGQEAFEVAVLGHILHSEGWSHSRTLLKRLHQALKPGGTLVVAEMIPDEERNKNVQALFFGLNMLACTDEGCVFTRSELEGLAKEAGFARIDWLEDAPSPSPIALFRKA